MFTADYQGRRKSELMILDRDQEIASNESPITRCMATETVHHECISISGPVGCCLSMTPISDIFIKQKSHDDAYDFLHYNTMTTDSSLTISKICGHAPWIEGLQKARS